WLGILMPNRADFDAARQAAIDCANASSELLRTASGRAGLTPAQERQIARLLDPDRPDEPPVGWSGDIAELLPCAVEALSEALASGWGVMEKVEDELTLAAPGPVTAGGMVRPNAHHLAWDFARNLWATIRDLDPRLDPQWEHFPSIDPSRFDLDADLI